MKHKNCKGYRYTRYYRIIQADGYWWDETAKEWTHYPFNREHNYSSHYPCRTKKAFRRHLKKYGLKGVKYTLISGYLDCDEIEAYGRNIER